MSGRRIGYVWFVLLLWPFHPLCAQQDSLGLKALDVEFELLGGALSADLTLGELRRRAPQISMVGLGPTSAAWGIRDRPDSVQITFGFDWNSGSVFQRTISDSAKLSEFEIFWSGVDSTAYRLLAGRILAALRRSGVKPSCIAESESTTHRASAVTHDEAVYHHDGLVGDFFVSRTEPPTIRYNVIFKIFRPLPSQVKYFSPVRTGWECAPNPDRILVVPDSH